MKVLVFDTETTGLPSNNYEAHKGKWYNFWGHIVQLSWILYDTETNSIIQQEDKIIKLDENIELPESSVNIHGITREIMNIKGNKLMDSIELFINSLEICDMIMGHNVNFDINMVRAEMIRSGAIDYFKLLNVPIVCTMKKYRKYCKILTTSKITGNKYYKYPKLMELHKKVFGNIPDNLHNALIDVIACLRCYMKIEYDRDILRDEISTM